MNVEHVEQFLLAWLNFERKVGEREKNAVVGISGGIDSAVVFMLCAQVMPTTGVIMPCHSSPQSISRAQELIEAARMKGLQVEDPVRIDLEDAFHSIVSQTKLNYGADKMAKASLRSCLRAPTLDYIAKLENALIFGTGNRDEDEVFRYYQKRGDGCVDNNVLSCLHKSEVRLLAAHLGVPQSILDAVPSADLWGGEEEQTDEGELGITYDEIEWVTKFMNDAPPQGRSMSDVVSMTPRQFEVLKKAIAAEIATRHKAQTPRCPDRRQLLTTIETREE